jgi:hypothetical protein
MSVDSDSDYTHNGDVAYEPPSEGSDVEQSDDEVTSVSGKCYPRLTYALT